MDLPHDKDYAVMLRVGDPEEVRLVRGDITKTPAEAIVNAANSELLPGGGVCGAIHRAGGPDIGEECRRIRSERGSVKAGHAVATTAGRLQAQYVIHAVGPVWHGGNHGEAEALSSCYRESMRIADELNLHSIAFPAISSAKHLLLVFVVLFDKPTLDVFANTALAQRKPESGHPYEVSIATYA